VTHRRFFMVSVVVHATVLACLARTSWPQPELFPTIMTTSVRFAPPPPPRLERLPSPPPPAKSHPTAIRPPVTPRVSVRPPAVATPALPLIASQAPSDLFQWRLPAPAGPAGVAGPPSTNDGNEPGGLPGASTNGVTGADVVASLTTPTYAQTPLPAYPTLARARGWEGTTLLRVEVLENGNVGRVEMLKSSGHAALDRSAVEAVKSWHFNPGRRGDAPTACFIDVPVRFTLDKAGV
jgi:periplasmic protein TonB